MNLGQCKFFRQQVVPKGLLVELRAQGEQGFVEDFVVVVIQVRNLVDVDPGVVFHQKLGSNRDFLVVNQGIVADRQGALRKPVLLVDGHVGLGVHLVVVVLNLNPV